MHIAQVFNGTIPPSGYGGIERLVYWLIREFLAQGHQITLIANRNSSLIKEFPQISFVAFDQLKTMPEKQLEKIDIFHFHNEVVTDWVDKYPYLVTEHGNNKKKKRYERNTVFLSQSHANNHNAQYFVSNGIPLEDYPLQIKKCDEIAFMAKLNWRTKNARTAIHLAFDTSTTIHLTGGFLKESRKVWGLWWLKYPFKKHFIKEHGEVDGEEKINILKQSMCLYYLVNWHEPFALAPHEAMACGTPVLATPNGALKEYIQHGVNGFIVNNYSQAVEAVEYLKGLTDIEREKMAYACRQSVYTIRDCVQQHVVMYEKILARGFLYSQQQADKIGFLNPPAIKVNKNFLL